MLNTKTLTSLLPVLVTVGRATATEVIQNEHKYFNEKLHRAVDKADSFSPQAKQYVGRYPTIDISPWIHQDSFTDEQRLGVVQQILPEIISTGSFNIVGHNVSIALLDRLEKVTGDFFSQSIEEKKKYATTETAFAGYTANQQEKYGAMVYKTDNPYEAKGDLREIYAMIYPPNHVDNIKGPASFQEAQDEFIEQLHPVDMALTEIFSQALSIAKGVDLPLSYVYDSDGKAAGSLRSHRYPAMPSEYDEATKFLPHTDFGTSTIIYGSQKGLEEIRDRSWIEVPIGEGELHVTLGQILHMWSNGLFADNIHRVSSNAAKDRISFAYFMAQGGSEEKVDGVEPICAQGEEPRFSPTSTSVHLSKYYAAMVEEKSVM